MSTGSTQNDVGLITEPKQADKSLGDLFANLGTEVGELVRKEFELAKTETRQEVRTATTVGASFAGAAAGALLALIFLSAALAWLLDQWINTALAFLIVGLIWAFATAVAVTVARTRMRELQPLPHTVETLKEDVEWAKQQKA